MMKARQGSLLELTNVIGAPIEIVDIYWRPKSGGAPIQFEADSAIEFPIRLGPTELYEIPEVVKIPYTNTSELSDAYQIEVVARIKGTEREYLSTATVNFSALSKTPIPSSSLANGS